MANSNYSKKALEAWEDARECDCGCNDCHPNSHRLCGICGDTILFGAYWGIESQRNSDYAWDVDHIKPLSRGGKDTRSNRRAVCVSCNRKKGNNRY